MLLTLTVLTEDELYDGVFSKFPLTGFVTFLVELPVELLVELQTEAVGRAPVCWFIMLMSIFTYYKTCREEL